MSSEAEQEAYTVLGQSVAGAILCATLFFIGGIIGIANLIYTSESFLISKYFFRCKRSLPNAASQFFFVKAWT